MGSVVLSVVLIVFKFSNKNTRTKCYGVFTVNLVQIPHNIQQIDLVSPFLALNMYLISGLSKILFKNYRPIRYVHIQS